LSGSVEPPSRCWLSGSAPRRCCRLPEATSLPIILQNLYCVPGFASLRPRICVIASPDLRPRICAVLSLRITLDAAFRLSRCASYLPVPTG